MPQSNAVKVEVSNDTGKDTGGVAASRLKSLIERIEKLEEEKTAIAADIKDVFAEAKGTGFDVKTMRKIIRLRKMDENKLAEEDALLETYRAAVGV
ncbi:MAG: DUF2312 domain-containing protein [Proteobacteria bacterium]|nr:DUF2312 domain-containing protein [Pseudomonadota bacterium]